MALMVRGQCTDLQVERTLQTRLSDQNWSPGVKVAANQQTVGPNSWRPQLHYRSSSDVTLFTLFSQYYDLSPRCLRMTKLVQLSGDLLMPC
ncbi:hypothetical protein RRG08_053245 [Elysia crispata]|uniref:Uncharacterized protein n=1 Tax=Elysia crispata TaxID=231223 RepID=A0AAE1E1J7_9GAST|nr:hypothetical protein RRG08_053245 [Elysia crispata]